MAGTLEMLRARGEFAALQDEGHSRTHPLLVVRFRRNGLGRDRFAISTGRRVGAAVVRNRVRRRIREVLRTRDHPAGPGWDILVVARPASATATYGDLREALLKLLAGTLPKEGTT